MKNNSEFYKELEALLAKHNINSLGLLCYNNPELVDKYNKLAWGGARKDGDEECDELRDELFFEDYDHEPVPGFWYSSRC